MAQTDAFNTKPQIVTPNVAAFLRYGDFNVGVNTGVPDIRIPLFNIESGSIRYGVDIDYNATGIKVAQLASSIGLAWSLNITGMISRTVRSLPDEYGTYGFIDLNKTYEYKYSLTSQFEIQKYADQEYDNEPDIFSFRLPTGEAGKFMYNLEERKIINDVNAGFKVDWVNRTSFLSNSFTITTTDGTKYFFEQPQLYFDDSAREILPSLRRYIQTWFLTKVENVKGDVITYQYETVSANATLPSGNSVQPEWLTQKSYMKKYLYNANPLDYTLSPVEYSESISNYSTVEPRIKEITTKQGRVVFKYLNPRFDYPGHQLNEIELYRKEALINRVSFSYSYFTTSDPKFQRDYRLKLDNIEIGITKEQKYSFIYDMSVRLPPTNSTQQDYWGYYNGNESNYLPRIKPPSLPGININEYVGLSDRNVNVSLIKAGILQEIVYPTGGKTSFNFEPNYYFGKTNQTVNRTFGRNMKVTGNSKKVPVSDTVDFLVDKYISPNTAYLNVYFSKLQQPSPYVDPPNMQVVKLLDLTNNWTVLQVNRSKVYTQPESIRSPIVLTQGNRYRLITTVVDAAAASLFDASYVEAAVTGEYSVEVNQNIYADGLRIKEISNYDQNNSLVNRDGFSYGSDGSGIVLRDLKDVDNNLFYEKWKITLPNCSQISDCECFYDRNYVVYVGHANILGPTLSGRHIYYNYVEKIQYNHNNMKLGKIGYSREINSSIPYRYYFPNGPYQAEFINNISVIGNVPSETYYRWDDVGNTFVKQRSISRQYTFLPNTFSMVKYYRKNIYSNNTCKYRVVENTSDLFGVSLFKISLPQYQLLNETVTDYDLSGDQVLISSAKDMEYDVIFGQLRKTTIVNSEEEKVDRYFVYPYDYIQPNIWLSKLLEKNIIGTPIETITLAHRSQGKNITQGQYSTYDNYGRRLAVYGLNLVNNGIKVDEFKISNRLKGILPPEGSATPFQPDDRYEKKIECLGYDLFNNFREILENGNLRTVYLWGYSGQYPIIEIKNATYAEVSALLTPAAIDNLNVSTHSEATMETL
ncbi:hypothetical protein K7A41_00330, partial [Sphingobacterium sp. InxBP1]|uniref:hypothetical protein n=1 Tax=Sphingobacterium sp. InxBP1 TaxID=2870328 RepID=UPI0022445F4D